MVWSSQTRLKGSETTDGWARKAAAVIWKVTVQTERRSTRSGARASREILILAEWRCWEEAVDGMRAGQKKKAET